MDEKKSERRENLRVGATFVVSYRAKDSMDGFDLSQTSNFSQGGVLLTTSQLYKAGDLLELNIMLPSLENKVLLTGKVHQSIEIVRDLICKTRVSFVELDDATTCLLKDTVKEFGVGE